MSTLTRTARIAGLYCYPVKSLRGFALEATTIWHHGLAGDRRFMLIDARRRFVSQRECPALASLVLEQGPNRLIFHAQSQASLTVATDNIPDCTLTVRVWDSQVTANDMGDAVANWLSDYFGRELRLVCFGETAKRLADAEYASDTPITFSDGFPVLVINQASLQALNTQTGFSLGEDRFRANLVLTGLDAFEEDAIERLEIDGLTLRLVKPCTRCAIPGIDQTTGQRSMDPLPWLKQHRYDNTLRGATFGWNAIITHGAGKQVHTAQAVVAHLRSSAA